YPVVRQRHAEADPGTAAVIIDHGDRHEPLHEQDSATTAAVAPRWVAPRSMIDDLEADPAVLDPEGQLDGAVERPRRVGVLDAVARRLVDGEHQVVLVVLVEGQCGQPAVQLGADRGQRAAVRGPDPVGERARHTVADPRTWLGHPTPPATRLRVRPVL